MIFKEGLMVLIFKRKR